MSQRRKRDGRVSSKALQFLKLRESAPGDADHGEDQMRPSAMVSAASPRARIRE
jgi:hypothetical protein